MLRKNRNARRVRAERAALGFPPFPPFHLEQITLKNLICTLYETK